MAPNEDRLEGVRLVERLRGMDGSPAVVGQNGWLWAMTAWNGWIDCSGRSKWMALGDDRLEGVRLVE